MKNHFKRSDRIREIKQLIDKLKKKYNAVILAHNYQLPEIQDIADFRGDSLGLSVEASKTKADVIVFCGVRFMAETAKIISPSKKVLLPDSQVGCPMAKMITAEQLKEVKGKNPEAKVLCYVNSSAEVKAESDVCCTSSNAVNIAEKAFNRADKIIFVPDKHLGLHVASRVDREFIFWPGFCSTHIKILPQNIMQKKREYPQAEVLVHPECLKEAADLADKVLSTGGMSSYVRESSVKEFIIGTEQGMVYRLQKDNPHKKIYSVTDLAVCPNMKKITLDKVVASLRESTEEIRLSEVIIERASKSIKEMLKYV